MSRYPFLITCILAAFPILTSGQSSPGQAISGAGATSCAKYVKDSSSRDLADFHVTWAQGFLSGMNMANRVATKQEFVLLPEPASIKAYLDKYCLENPSKSPMTGSMAMYRDLKK